MLKDAVAQEYLRPQDGPLFLRKLNIPTKLALGLTSYAFSFRQFAKLLNQHMFQALFLIPLMCIAFQRPYRSFLAASDLS